MVNQHPKTSTLNKIIIQIINEKNPKSIKQLIELILQQQSSFPLSQQEIIQHILNLQNQGKLTLKENSVLIPMSLKNYLLSSHSYWYWIVIALALATTTTVLIIPENVTLFTYIRYILGSIFVLFLPGYSLIKLLFLTKELNNIEQVALSIGMSVALVPITGLILYYTPWGITNAPITLSLLTLTTIFATAAIAREHQHKINKAIKSKPRPTNP
jgi:hypothetical protein